MDRAVRRPLAGQEYLDPSASALRVAAAAAVTPFRVFVRVLTCAVGKTEVTAEFVNPYAVTSVVCALHLARNHASLPIRSVRGSIGSLMPSAAPRKLAPPVLWTMSTAQSAWVPHQ